MRFTSYSSSESSLCCTESRSPLLQVCGVGQKQVHQPYHHGKQGRVGMAQKARKMREPGTPKQHEANRIRDTMDSAGEEKGRPHKRPDCRIHGRDGAVGPEAVG